MIRILSTAFLIAAVFTTQAFAVEVPFPEELRSYVAIKKSKNDDNNFVFLVCSAGSCDFLGRSTGYTRDQISSMHGTLRQWGAGGLAIAEVIAIVAGGYFAGVGVIAIGGETLVMSARGAAAVGIGSAEGALYYFDVINPLEMYRKGREQNRMADAVAEMVANGNAAVPVYRDTNLKNTLEVAQRIEGILKGFN